LVKAKGKARAPKQFVGMGGIKLKDLDLVMLGSKIVKFDPTPAKSKSLARTAAKTYNNILKEYDLDPWLEHFLGKFGKAIAALRQSPDGKNASIVAMMLTALKRMKRGNVLGRSFQQRAATVLSPSKFDELEKKVFKKFAAKQTSGRLRYTHFGQRFGGRRARRAPFPVPAKRPSAIKKKW